VKFVLGFLVVDFAVGITTGVPVAYEAMKQYQQTLAEDQIKVAAAKTALSSTILDLCAQIKSTGSKIILTHPLNSNTKNLCE